MTYENIMGHWLSLARPFAPCSEILVHLHKWPICKFLPKGPEKAEKTREWGEEHEEKTKSNELVIQELHFIFRWFAWKCRFLPTTQGRRLASVDSRCRRTSCCGAFGLGPKGGHQNEHIHTQ
jgi:hypothetical protein